jgi:hypothetical protein
MIQSRRKSNKGNGASQLETAKSGMEISKATAAIFSA